jgi:hypothetical protein
MTKLIKFIKKVIKFSIPPIFSIAYLKFKERGSRLFGGDDSLFKSIVQNAIVYAEYGIGKSTCWVSNNTSAYIIAVDTSEYWINLVQKEIGDNNRALIFIADMGDIGDVGRPKSYDFSHNFSQYFDLIWHQSKKPDCVLIDGRFRVCCFLTTLKFADEGTFIFFDDYIDRPHYHFIEKYVNRHKECGRQCLFIKPSNSLIDFKELDKDIDLFRYVMD